MNRSTPGLPFYHQLPEFTQTHVHWVSDAIQPSHPLSSLSPLAPNPSQHQSFPMSQLFAWGGQSTGVSALASFFPKKSQGWSPSEYFVIYLVHWEIPRLQTISPFSFNKIYLHSSYLLFWKHTSYFPYATINIYFFKLTFWRLVEDISRWHQAVLVSPSQEDKGKFIPI